MAEPAGANVIGLPEFLRGLRQLDGNWDAALALAHQKIASKGAAYARAAARGMGGVQAKSASAIGEKHDPRKATIAVLPSRYLDAMANAAFWGAKQHSGWYRARRYANSPAQHPRWIGNSWEVAVRGQGPYAINDALASRRDQLLDEYLDEIERIARAAFPERGNR